MTDKTLATFRIDPQEWEQFKNAVSIERTNASAVLLEFVRWYSAGNRLNTSARGAGTNLDTSLAHNLDTVTSNNLDRVIDERLDNMEQRLDTVTSNNLDRVIDERLDKMLDERGLKPEIIKERLEEQYAELAIGLNSNLCELRSQLEELRGKSKAR
ncbi:MAG: hypothetical protein ICV78_00245 [Tolypothrix sp. Co-bin9]|nr:hypothetical protein [Tolypothrix sp. Co-bin9]